MFIDSCTADALTVCLRKPTPLCGKLLLLSFVKSFAHTFSLFRFILLTTRALGSFVVFCGSPRVCNRCLADYFTRFVLRCRFLLFSGSQTFLELLTLLCLVRSAVVTFPCDVAGKRSAPSLVRHVNYFACAPSE